MKAES